MYTVIIADDEPKICQLIRHLIHWDRLQLELLCMVSDGRELYEAVVRQRPDIVVTDVAMPQLTGLEVAQKVSAEGIACNFIIISGHRRFDYVQDAIKNGACDYLLKPINEEELNNTISKICRTIDRRKAYEDTEQKHLQMEERQRQISQGSLVTHVFLHDAELPGEIEVVNAAYDTAFAPGVFAAAVFYVEGSSDETVAIASEKVREILLQQASEGGIFLIADREGHGTNCLVNSVRDADVLKAWLEQAYAQIRQYFDMFSGIYLTVGCGKITADISGISQSADDASAAVRERIRLGRNRIFFTPEEQPERILHEKVLSRSQLQELISIFEGLNPEKYEAWIHTLCGAEELVWSGNAWYVLCEKIGSVFDLVLHDENKSREPLSADMIRELEAALPAELENALIWPVVERMRQINMVRDQQSSRPVRKAREYIEAHYMEQITLEEVASHVYLHPAYLSGLFKKTYGIGFMEYVSSCRLDRAKYLLTHTSDTVYTIARQVGYADARSFSRFFQKEVGIKPTDYRRIHG